MSPSPLPLMPRLRDRFLPFAIALLLVMQTFGLVHRTVHAEGVAHAVASASEHGLLTDHTGLECRLLDQLAVSDLATLPLVDVPHLASAYAVPTATQPGMPPTRARTFRARDPPSSLA